MDYGTIFTASIAAFTAMVGSFFTWLATRPKSHADANLTAAQTFQILTQELRQERIELAEVIERQGAKIEAQSEEITRLRGVVSNFESRLDDLMVRWRRGEDPPPPEPKGNR